MKKITLLFIFTLIACSESNMAFNKVNYVDDLYAKDCSSLDVEKNFVLKSNEQLSHELDDNTYIASDIVSTTLSFGVESSNNGTYSSHSYFGKRIEENNFKLDAIQKEKERKLCKN